MITPREAIPVTWKDLLLPYGRIGIGLDVATSDGKHSNPSSLTVMQEIRPKVYRQRLKVIFKTRDPDVTRAFIRLVLADIASLGLRAVGGCIDASNEAFFAEQLISEFASQITFVAIKGGANVEFERQTYKSKELLGNLYCNAIEEGRMSIPEVPESSYVKDDHRLVVRINGGFEAPTGPDGQHADTFDSGKLAQFALEGISTSVTAHAASVGSYGSNGQQQGGRLKEFLRKFIGPKAGGQNRLSN